MDVDSLCVGEKKVSGFEFLISRKRKMCVVINLLFILDFFRNEE